jgi:hypothetical protein
VLWEINALPFWDETAALHHFSPFLEASFGANLLYTLLLNFGSFSGKRIDDWHDQQAVMLQAALAETPTFNGDTFKRKAVRLKQRWGAAIRFVNMLAIIWASLAALSCIASLFIVAFYPAFLVRAHSASIAAALLLGAIPAGLLCCVVLHAGARINMYSLTKEWKTALNYITKISAEKLTESRSALRTKRKNR